MSKVIQSMFYNANYNLGYPDGQSKFIWGVQQIDFSKDIQKQLVGDLEVFNFNLTSLNPIFDPYHDENKLVEENQILTTDKQNAISLMSPSWQHAAEKEPDLMTRYVIMAENQFKKKNEDIERLTAIATKHATLNDERYELIEKQKSDIEKMLDQLFKHEKVDAWLVCKMNDMLDDVNHQLDKSRIEAVGD